MTRKTPNYPIRTLNNTISILETLLQHNFAMSVTEISEKVGMYSSSVHRILDTLSYRGYVEQDPDTQKYQLGLKVVELGMAKLHRMNLVREARLYLKELVNQCNETVHLGVLDQGEVLYVAKEEPDQTIRMVSKVGKRASLHCTGVGKVLLAYLSEEERKKILERKEFPRFTEKTITDKRRLKTELYKVRKQGFALDRGEHEKGLRCVAVPIRDHHGNVIAAISVSVPVFRINTQKQNYLKKILIQASEKISKRLGWETMRNTED